jgi:general secretion pathway protein E
VRAGLDYLRIDPLKVDVGKVADTMSAAYAERHRVLPVQVTRPRWWWPPPSRS